MEVKSCGDVLEARKLVGSFQPDLVFLDCKIRGDRRAGLKYLQELKTGHFPSRVIMLSGEDDRELVFEAVRSGAAGFVSKSDDKPLSKAISILLQGGTYISPQALSGLNDSDDSDDVALTWVGPEELNITAPQVYKTLWHIANGDYEYKNVAHAMNKLSPETVSGYAQKGFEACKVGTKLEFLGMLYSKGWRLRSPY